MKIANLTTFKFFKRMGTATTIGLQVYRNVLFLKLSAIDILLKAVKPSPHLPVPTALSKAKVLPAPIKETREKKEMKKSNGFAVFMFFAAVCSALGAMAYYLYKKEKELGDYEDMLFSEEYLEGYMPNDDCTQEDCCTSSHSEKAPEEPTFE